MKKYILLFIYSFAASFAIAALDDHGRLYRDCTGSNLTNIIGFLLLIIIIIGIGMAFVRKDQGSTSFGHQQKDKKHTDNSKNEKNEHHSAKFTSPFHSIPCKSCNGYGCVKGEEISWNDDGFRICFYCNVRDYEMINDPFGGYSKCKIIRCSSYKGIGKFYY